MNQAKIAILSSVPKGIFQNIPSQFFLQNEIFAAQKEEIDVWRDTLKLDYLKKNTTFEVHNILEGLPKAGEYDGYILGGSPSMVSEQLPWMQDLQKFIHQEVDAGKSVLGICFGHQILAKSFGGEVNYAPSRNIGVGEVFLNTLGEGDVLFGNLSQHFEALYSHKQYVSDTGETESLGYNEHTPNQIIKVGENAWGIQFHPEFSKDFMSFLMTLMQKDLGEEGFDTLFLKEKLSRYNKKESDKIITLFVENIIK